MKVSTLAISGFPFGSPETKCHLNVGLVERRIVYYKWEGGGFPQVWVVVSLVSPNCPWLVLAPKVFQLCTNHLVLILCRFVWVVEACQFFLIPSRSSNTPLYPSKVLQAREHAPTFYSFVIFSFNSHLKPSRSWERINQSPKIILLDICNIGNVVFASSILSWIMHRNSSFDRTNSTLNV